MKLSRSHKNRRELAPPAPPKLSPGDMVPRKPTKAIVAAVVTVLGLVGIHVTTGTAQAIVMVGQVVLVVYGVWRARNLPKRRGAVNHDPGGLL